MSSVTAAAAQRKIGSNTALFFRRWLAGPPQTDARVPSLPALRRRIAAYATRGANEAGPELGAGTGVVSRALLDAVVPPERVFGLKNVLETAEHLRRTLPGTQAVCGDAFDIGRFLPPRWRGRIDTAIRGLALVLLPSEEQRRFVEPVEAVAPGRGLLL